MNIAEAFKNIAGLTDMLDELQSGMFVYVLNKSEPDLSETNAQGDTLLHAAINARQPELALQLIALDTEGKMVNARDKSGATPIMRAILKLDDSGTIMQVLLAAAAVADINITDSKNFTARDHADARGWRRGAWLLERMGGLRGVDIFKKQDQELQDSGAPVGLLLGEAGRLLDCFNGVSTSVPISAGDAAAIVKLCQGTLREVSKQSARLAKLENKP